MPQTNTTAIDAIRAEMLLGKAARDVFSVSSRESIAKRLGNLITVATENAQIVAELEETDDPRIIARNALILVTVDIRAYWDDETEQDPEDSYSRYLAENRAKLPVIHSVLDQVLLEQN